MYAEGRGVSQNYKEAVKWYKLASEHGFAAAKCDLSDMYAKGSGIKKDLVTAKRLAKEGFEAGVQYCEEVWKEYNLADY